MLNFSITWWELALIVIAIAFIVAVFYAVRTLKSLIITLNNVNSLISENKRSIDNIFENVDGITKDANKISDKADNMAGELNNTVTAVKADVVNPLIQALATLVKLLSTSANRRSHQRNQE